MKATHYLLPVVLLTSVLLSGCDDDDNDDDNSTNNATAEVAVTDPGTQASTPDTTLLDESVDDFMETANLPGLSLTLFSHESETPVILSRSYGLANIESSTPVDENTSFRIASATKPVVGALLQIAQEQGLLQLDTDIRAEVETLSGFSIDDPMDREITLRDLATHTSGIRDSENFACVFYVNNDDGSVDSLAELYDYSDGCGDLAGRTSTRDFLAAYLDSDGVYYLPNDNFGPTRAEYSNIGVGLAGHYLEEKSGQSLQDYGAAHLFRPLGMTNTGWTRESLANSTIATAYLTTEGDPEAFPYYDSATTADGGLLSSSSDLVKLLMLIMNDGVAGGNQLIQSTSVADLLTPSPEDADYGFLWIVEGTKIGHDGSDPGAISVMQYDAETRTGFAFVANGDAEGINRNSLGNLLEEIYASALALE